MTMIDTMSLQNNIYNPNCQPLDEVKIKTLSNGQYIDIPALDKHWVAKGREFTHYSPPPHADVAGSPESGALEAWLERMSYLNADLRWLLNLDHHRFWSQIVFDGRTVAGIEHFLQEAHPYYLFESFPKNTKVLEEYEEAQHLAFLVMSRIICEKESERDWIKRQTLAQLWYDEYIITLPMIFDLCLLYGDTNTTYLSSLIQTVFEIQPMYKEDLKNAVCFIGERLNLMQDKMNSRKISEQHYPAKLDERNFNTKPHLTLMNISDMILYLLDTVLNLSTFLFVYQPACPILHDLHFENRIVSVYEHTIPIINENLTQLARKDDTIDIYFDLKYKLDVVRVQMIKIFRCCLFSPINTVIKLKTERSENSDEIKILVEDFISTLSEFLAEKFFIQDYHKAHPVDQDLGILSEVYPELDSLKCDFLMESVLSCFDLPKQKKEDRPSSINGCASREYLGPSNSGKPKLGTKMNGVELESLVTQVKDLLPHLGRGFIQKCLDHYAYDSASVINAVLENTLPDSLLSLDPNMPEETPVESPLENAHSVPNRVNVFDNDEFDIMTRDSIDTTRVHKGKWKMKYKNLNEMLDDKSHIAQLKESFTKLGIVEGDEDVYDDEYDDTYDGLDVSVGEAGESERRQFVTPRVLMNQSTRRGGREEKDGEDNQSEFDDGEDDQEENQMNRDNFVENPEVVRERLERQRQNKYRHRGGQQTSTRDVAGKPKGQGQDKKVLENRDRKNTSKSFVGNHNRRAMAQRKRNQGMMPS